MHKKILQGVQADKTQNALIIAKSHIQKEALPIDPPLNTIPPSDFALYNLEAGFSPIII